MIPLFMLVKKLLYCLTVHDRLTELRANRLLVRRYLPDFDLKVFSNSPGNDGKYQDDTDDEYLWCENRGHYEGALDHVDMVAQAIDGYEYVVVQAAKSIWTDITLVNRVVEELRKRGGGIAFMEGKDGGGHFGSGMLSFFCDFIVADVETYKKIFPIPRIKDDWPECIIARRVKELIHSDHIFMIPNEAPKDGGNSDTFVFQKVMGTQHDLLSQRSCDAKLNTLKAKNVEAYTLVTTGKIPEANPVKKLHLGCGGNRMEGWVNVDIGGGVDVQADLGKQFPFGDGTADIMYSEHMIEHLNVDQVKVFLRECHRVLKPGGVCRIATPSLDHLIKLCYEGRWKEQDWLTWPAYQHVKTSGEMFNMVFREWGHQYVFDYSELDRRLRDAGFSNIYPVEWGASQFPYLRNVETRKDSLLIVEAIK